jgi:hypothetical protein
MICWSHSAASAGVTAVTEKISSAPQCLNCNMVNLLLTGCRRRSSPQMYASPTADRAKATVRMIAASFAAGAGLMLCVGLAAPLMTKGVLLEVRSAEASTLQSQTPVIEPLDVEAIQAQLAAADRTMAAARATTDDDIARLARLTPR